MQTEKADAASRWREETAHAFSSAFGGASALQLRKYILNDLDRGRFVTCLQIDQNPNTVLFLLDNSALHRQVVVEADDAVRPHRLD